MWYTMTKLISYNMPILKIIMLLVLKYSSVMYGPLGCITTDPEPTCVGAGYYVIHEPDNPRDRRADAITDEGGTV